MTALARLAIALLLSALAAFPQQPRAEPSLAEVQSAMLGDWVVTFPNPGWGRGRLAITKVLQNPDGSFQIVGMYAYGENEMAALRTGELTLSGSASQLNFTVARGGVFVGKSQGEGGFQGELTPAKGPKTTFRMEKAEGQSVAAAAPVQDSVNTPGMAESRQAIERNPVRRPYVEVGDCWTYRKTDPANKKKRVYDYTSCVTYVDKSKDVIFAVDSTGGVGTDHTYTIDWNPVVDQHTVRSETHFLKFPVHVGDTYSFEVDYRNTNHPLENRKRKWDMKVVGWEDVAVPAGMFRAVRIEGIGIGGRASGTGNFSPTRHQVTIWYVPEVNREVKRIHNNGALTVVHELTQYRLNR